MAKANRKKKQKKPALMVIAVDDLKAMLGSKLKRKDVRLSEEQVGDLYFMFREAYLYR